LSVQIVIVDNNDSFTYNLVEHFRKTGLCQVDVVQGKAINVAQLDCYDAIVLSPGPGLPKERPYLKQILDVYKKTKPILGVCLGHQAIFEYFGGGIKQLGSIIHGEATAIAVDNGSPLYHSLGAESIVGRYHSWVVDRGTLPSEIKITGQTPDGIIMSAQHVEYNIQTVQYHPESILTTQGLVILKNWLEFCILAPQNV
jgi:anthranilate synthase component 2